MNSCCSNTKNHIQNYNEISCCVEYLLQLNKKTENNLLTTKFGIFLLRTLNHYSKKNQVFSATVSFEQFKDVLLIIVKYTAMYYFRNKIEYVKLLVKCGIEIINSSQHKNKEEIVSIKNALVNNVACVYCSLEQEDKAMKFLDKSVKMNRTYIDNAITYNNLGLIELKNKRIQSGVHYFHLAYKEIKNHLNEDNTNNKELFCFIMLNYIMVSKKYSQKDYDEKYDNFYEYCNTSLGEKHYISVRMSSMIKKDKTIEKHNQEEKQETIFSRPSFSQENDFFFSVKTKSENKKSNIQEEAANIIKNRYYSTSPIETPIVKKQSKSFIQESNNNDNSPSTKDNQDSFLLSKKEQKTTTKLPFKRKLHLKDIFKMAIQASTPAKPPSKLDSLFSFIANKAKVSSPPMKKIERRPSKENCTQKQNEYDEIMNKATNSKKVEITEMSNSSVNQKIQSVASIHHQSKRFSVMNRPKENNVKVKSSFPTENVKRRATQLFKHLLLCSKEDIKLYPDTFETIFDFSVLDDMNNFFKSKIKSQMNLDNEVNRMIGQYDLTDNSTNNNDSINTNSVCTITKTLQHNGSVPYIISIFSTGNNMLNFQISNMNSNSIVFESNVNYEDVIDYLNKISFYTTMPTYCNINQLRNIPMFVSKVLVHHLQIINKDNKISLGIADYQIGISEQKFELVYLETECICTFTISNNMITIVLFNKRNEEECIKLDVSADDSSFKMLFTSKVEYGIKRYIYNSGYDYQTFFSELFLKIQEIQRISVKNEHVTFSEIANAPYYNVYKIYLEKKLMKKELWMISFIHEGSEFKWNVDFYSMDKIEISNASFYIKKAITLDEGDFTNLIGMEPKDIFELMSDKDIVIANYLMLHSVKMRNIMTKILTESNYDSMIRLMKIKPSCFFRFNFSMIHIKRYFTCAFEFVVYSRENFFLRLMLTETLTCRSYSKLFIPYYMYSNITNMNELKKSLEEKYKLSKKLFKNKKKLKAILYEESETILTKSLSLVIYESIDVIIEKLNVIKD